MATIAEVADRRVSIGRIFNRAFSTIGSNPLTIFGISFLFGALPSVILDAILQSRQATQNAPFDFTTLLLTAGIAVLTLAFTFLAQGALVRATVAYSDGQPVSFAESALAGLRKILPLLGLAILLGLIVMFGLALLIVPGIILYLVLSVATPALVEENCGIFGAFGRSAALTKGARWNIFALELVVLVIYWIISAVVGLLVVALVGFQGFANAAQGLSIGFLAISAVSSTLAITIVSTIQTSLYVELRNWKDGPATEALTDIFG
ncbi:MAG: hypothetical protein ACRCS5_01345 [Sphingomonas sp.]|uniref:hypothetical protein n=1 Tax=Sphingomonas sp. TaxID=28214 RepID=UPI0030FBA8A7